MIFAVNFLGRRGLESNGGKTHEKRRLREQDQEYLGGFKNVKMPVWSLGERCFCSTKDCLCNEFSNEERANIFKEVWGMS